MRLYLLCAVSPNALPAEITVYTCGKTVCYRKTVFRPLTAFCLCLTGAFTVSVRPLYADYGRESRFIRFLSPRCPAAISLAFNFPATNGPGALQRFTLTDAKYRFPVAEATLTFENARAI